MRIERIGKSSGWPVGIVERITNWCGCRRNKQADASDMHLVNAFDFCESHRRVTNDTKFHVGTSLKRQFSTNEPESDLRQLRWSPK